jgi:ElaB/YqjD/DUF883 family membrane-anchored ribosome-binding protein
MSKDDSYAKLSFSTCFAGAVGSLLTYVVGEYPDDKFWRGVMYVIPPLTLVVYTVTDFIESRVKEWWADKSEKADVDFIVQECESILKDDAVGDEHKAEALETRNNAKMSALKNKVQRLKKHAVVEPNTVSANAKRNRPATVKS